MIDNREVEKIHQITILNANAATKARGNLCGFE